MTYRAGRNLVRLAGLLVLISLLAFFWAGVVWIIAGAVLAATAGLLADAWLLRCGWPHLAVRRELPAVTGRDVPFSLALVVANGGPRPARVELRDDFPPEAEPRIWAPMADVPAGGTARLDCDVRIPVRGQFAFGPVWVRLHAPLGFLERQGPLPGTAPIKVLPERFSSRDRLSKDAMDAILLLDKLVHARQHGVGTEFESLAEYREGDDPRRIDWRTTARCRRPIIRRYQIERHRDVMILVDCGRLMGADATPGKPASNDPGASAAPGAGTADGAARMTKLDCAVDAALLLGQVALQSGDRCGVGVFDDRVLGYLPPLTGPRALRTLAECLYDARSRFRESDFSRMFATLQTRQAKRSLVVVLSDVVDAETSGRFRTSLATLARRHVVVFAALRTPLLEQLQTAPIGSLLDASRKAVAFRLLRERERAIHALRRSGVHIVDVAPQELTIPLINCFVELRRRNLL